MVVYISYTCKMVSTMARRSIRYGGGAAALVCLGCTVWVAWADWLRRSVTDEGFSKALAMAPGNWAYYRDLAEFRPAAAVVNLRKAIALNPLNPSLRIELAEFAERAGDFAAAAAAFRSATSLDNTYSSWGSLAGFYLRRKDGKRFAVVAPRALELADSGEDLFQGCLDYGVDVPARLWGGYLGWLMGNGHMGEARGVAEKIMAADERRFTQIMGDYMERLLAGGDVSSAWTVWNWLRPPRPSGLGFSWRYFSGKGVYFDGDRVTLTGDEPENFDLVWRYVYLAPSADYSIRASDLPSGFRWLVEGNRLVLRYERVKGVVRYEGEFRVALAELVTQ